MSEKPLDTEKEESLNQKESEDELKQTDEQVLDEWVNEEEEGLEDLEASSADDQNDSASRLAQLEEELTDVNNRYLRLQADFDNFRRRTREEKTLERKLRAQELVNDLLPVLDNFQRALNSETSHEEAASLKQGMEMVYRQLFDALKKEGVEEVDALNQPFDPNLHQAVMQEAVDGVEPNTVVDVFQAGYSLNGRVIRPAMVKVSAE